MPAVSRLGDLSTADPCGAPARGNDVASSNVFVNGIAVHRQTDGWIDHACPLSAPHDATTTGGSGTVFVNGLPITRIGDTISCGSTIAAGSSNVFAGG
jgi:uncharacterized Zn-binding protein involved in type VI secretion